MPGNPNPSPATRFTSTNNPSNTEQCRKGGKASVKVRQEKKRTAEVISSFFSMHASDIGLDVSDIPPEVQDTITVQDLLVYRQLRKASDSADADLGSFSALLDRLEGKPQMNISTEIVDKSADTIDIDEALSLVKRMETKSPKGKK